MTDQLIKIGEAGGPDLLYRLQGHTPSYTSWAYDVFDADPMNVQVRVPRRTPHRRPAARALPRCLARAAWVVHCAPVLTDRLRDGGPCVTTTQRSLIVPPCALSRRLAASPPSPCTPYLQFIHTPEEWAADDYALMEDRVDQIAISGRGTAVGAFR